MSFRNRLTLFFVVIVIVPMIAVALVLFRLIADSETGKADAGVAAAARAAGGLYRLETTDSAAQNAISLVQHDFRLAEALAKGYSSSAQRHAEKLMRAGNIRRLQIVQGDKKVADAGDPTAIAPTTFYLVDAKRKPLGLLSLSMTSATNFAALVKQVTGVDAALTAGGKLLASTLPGVQPGLPTVGNVTVGGHSYRVAEIKGQGFIGNPVEVSVLSPRASTSSAISDSRLVAGGVLIGFFALAFAFALLVSRSLQQQIAGFLEAARRLGTGDFATRVPVSGHDEFAALGEQFNRMSQQLETRLEELRQQRARLERSLQRIGETFASNLDRDALLGIVLRTAVDGVAATSGRASVRPAIGDRLREAARVGDVATMREALYAAEAAALKTGGPSDEEVGGAHALAHPLAGSDGSKGVFGLISVARNARPFDEAEIELFDYLARQAAVSVENVGLHEQVQQQAITDDLTGLFNYRRFQEALEAEIERSRRFDQPVGLVLLDLDDFKKINDTRGHQQGDVVLREIAKLLRQYSREIDAPARYGGEELALVLPQTDLEGAYQLAERLREGIEQHEIPLLDGGGTMHVTASIGVAAFPDSATDPKRLLAIADAALYDAKRAGKNKTVRAQ
jgi:diguanylate cyclase (GGDEF)-like protein